MRRSSARRSPLRPMFMESMEMGMSGDIIAEDLKMVLEELGEITGGQISSQETLNNIFKHFCIGK